jgi:hypothetical protein
MSPAAACDGAARMVPPGVLEHTAVLSLPDGTPFSEVVETYTNNVLAFAHGLPGVPDAKLPACR